MVDVQIVAVGCRDGYCGYERTVARWSAVAYQLGDGQGRRQYTALPVKYVGLHSSTAFNTFVI